MASIKPHKYGFRVQICVLNVRDSKVFRTKREASAWASIRESEIRSEKSKPTGELFTLLDALRKYGKEVSPHKKGVVKERIRLQAFEDLLPCHLMMSEVTPAVLAQWRDKRLQVVKPGSVLRDFSLLSNVFEVARREWGWIKENPISDVRRPSSPPHRDRTITWSEIRLMLKAMHYTRKPVRSVSHAVACSFLLALRTGMRAGELCSLPWEKVYPDYATVSGKTGIRNVSLTHQANRIIKQFYGWDETLVAGIKPQTLDAMFRKYRKYRNKVGLSGFTFHDTRHTAATRIAQKIQVLDLCKLFGWKNPKQALVYFNPTASDISKRLSTKVR